MQDQSQMKAFLSHVMVLTFPLCEHEDEAVWTRCVEINRTCHEEFIRLNRLSSNDAQDIPK